ncbi:hypothetical protein CMI45_01775 [Candidatus Pacearchaeota archaeon]|nr:hypothetical protein [Candidatus Pacearchaeota archaeon]|tara:strand:- start:79 stop:561 length:483 start_codon:yes stop_codon:yes gene_type:complete
MVRKGVDDKICRDCGKLIIGRRINAIVCKECRMRARKESSQRKKESDKRERILKKIERTGIKGSIERKKSEQILKDLKEEFEKEGNPEIELSYFSQFLSRPVEPFGLHSTSVRDMMKEFELRPFKDFIEEKIEIEKEKVKKEEEEKRELRNTFHLIPQLT